MKEIIDIHCHVLPFLDDGAKTVEQSKNMLKIAYKDGIRKIIATPHYKAYMTSAGSEEIKKTVSVYNEALDKTKLQLRIYSGNELFYDSDLVEALRSKKVCTLADSNYVLIEFNPSEEYTYIRNALYNIQAEGYNPILAHCERYECLVKDYQKVEELRHMEIKLQMNASTILGKYGKELKNFSDILLKNEVVSYVASDAHGDHHRTPRLLETAEYVAKKFGREYAEEIFHDNQMKIINYAIY